LPVSFLISFFEIFGLVMVLPIINVLIKPELISASQYLNVLYSYFNFTNNVTFVLLLLSIVTSFFLLKNLFVYWASRKQSEISFSIASQLSINRYEQYMHESYA